MQYCFTILLCAMRRFIMEQELTRAFGDIWATRSRCCCSSFVFLPRQIVIFFWTCVVIVLVDVVCGCDVKLLLGRITFDLWSRWKFEPCVDLYPALHIPTDSTLLVSSTCFPVSFSLQWLFSDHLVLSPPPLPITCSCPIQLYCGPTQAFTQYIKLN